MFEKVILFLLLIEGLVSLLLEYRTYKIHSNKGLK